MKTTTKILSLACASALFASPVFADNTDSQTVNVGGTVVAALELTNGTNTAIVMPDVVLPASGESNAVVTLTCSNTGAGTVSYSGANDNPFASGNPTSTIVEPSSSNADSSLTPTANPTGTCADIVVTGENSFNYMISTAVTTATPTTNGTGITLSAPVCTSASDNDSVFGSISATGTDTIYCGATITVDDTASAGDYSGAVLTATVVYD